MDPTGAPESNEPGPVAMDVQAASGAGQPLRDPGHWTLPVLATLAVIWVLHWAQAVLIPIMLAVLASYALRPAVEVLRRWRIPRAVGAAVLLLAMLGSMGALAISLSDEAAAWIETLPEAASNLRTTLRRADVASSGTIDQIQEAAKQLEQAASETGGGASPAPRGVTRVQIEAPRLDIQRFLWSGTLGALAAAGQAGAVLFLTYFLLASGDTFRRKLVMITGPVLSKRKITIRVLDEITSQIQRHLLVQIGTSVLVGVATWFAMRWVGLEHAAIWGIVAAVMNNVPYAGPLVVTGGTALVALLQFGRLEMAFLVGALTLLITSLEGYLLNPWLAGRASRMNAVAVFLSLLVWGWLWGVWGLLLGMPIMLVVKVVCDRVEGLQPVGELLGK